MALVAWDRLLETYCNRHADLALLVPGSPPVLWIDQTWRALQVAPLTEADVMAMANEQLPSSGAETFDGYSYVDFSYGNVAQFRMMAFGHPQARMIVLCLVEPPLTRDL